MNCKAPLMTPSFITLGPATLTHVTLISPSPSALACFSTSLSRSISISGRKLTPYCCATLISPSSAFALMAMAESNATSRQCLVMAMTPPNPGLGCALGLQRHLQRQQKPGDHVVAGDDGGKLHQLGRCEAPRQFVAQSIRNAEFTRARKRVADHGPLEGLE